MFIILQTIKAMLKKKKMQNVLIGLIIVSMATLLYLGVALATQANGAVKMFQRANAGENLMFLEKDDALITEIKDWWIAQDDIETVLQYDGLMINLGFDVLGEQKSEIVTVTEFPKNDTYDLMYESETQLAKAPKANEILVNYSFAKGRNLQLNDSLTMTVDNKTYTFILTGYLVDPHFSNPFLTPQRCFVAPGFFEENSILATDTILSVKYKDIKNVDDLALGNQLSKDLGKDIILIDYNTFLLTYQIISGIIAAILMVVAVFIFLIVVFVIRSMVKNIILQQYRQIGVKKVIGFDNNQIRHSYIWMYVWLASLASIIGVCIGMPIKYMINKGLSEDIQVGIGFSVDGYSMLTVVIIVGLVGLFTSIATKQANKIKPVQAIKYGMPENQVTTHKFNISNFKKMPLSILLATKQLLVNSKKTIATTFIITILVYVSFTINNIGFTLSDYPHFASYLFGVQIGDFAVVNNSSRSVDEFLDIIESTKEVDQAVFYAMELGMSTRALDQSNIGLVGNVLYGHLPEDSFRLTDGRQPKADNEIVLTNQIADLTGKKAGDYIELESKEGIDKLLIVGLGNSSNNTGNTYYAVRTEIPLDLQQNSGYYWMYTSNENVIIEDVEAALSELVEEDLIVTRYDSNIKNALSTLDVFPSIVRTLLIVFLIICAVIIINFTMMDIKNSTRMYGLLKATGFSNTSISKILMIKSLVITTIGICIGFVLQVSTINVILDGIFSVTPFASTKLPVKVDVTGSLVLVVLFIIISLVATFMPARKIRTISPKILMTE